MSVMIHNKEYFTVAERLEKFHKEHPKGYINTEIISNAGGVVTVKALVRLEEGRLFTGHASEKESSSMINKTSALENCETSAVGRALAFAGYAGTEIASADEVAQAISGQAHEIKSSTHYVDNVVDDSSKLIDDKGKQDELYNLIVKMNGGNKEESEIKRLLMEFTTFVGRDKTEVKGVSSFKDLKGKRLQVTLDKVKQSLSQNTPPEEF